MNWHAVARTNRVRSARKARRERNAAELKSRIAKAGGPFTAAEIRTAPHRMERPAPGYVHERLVFAIRGRDWVLGYSDGDNWQALAPFVAYRQDADLRDAITIFPGARKALADRLAAIFPTE